jgi:putative tRNA adenosine deaminase-associated protein
VVVTYIASALQRADDGWTGTDLDLSEVDDLDGLADALRADGTALCLLEEDDEYVGIVRVDGDEDPRVFVSDRRVLEASGLAARLLAATLEAEAEPVEDDEDDEEEEGGRPEVEPAGDDALLADLGVSADRLLELCAEEGMLPSDVIFAVGEAIGAADVLERVRGV